MSFSSNYVACFQLFSGGLQFSAVADGYIGFRVSYSLEAGKGPLLWLCFPELQPPKAWPNPDWTDLQANDLADEDSDISMLQVGHFVASPLQVD